MQCPRCESKRVQRDYDNANPVIRLIGMSKVLCNNCGLVFRGFDPKNKLRRTPTQREAISSNRRRGPRYRAHLPSAISLIEQQAKDGKVTYSEPSKGHCETISNFGMGLSLVGTRFSEKELSRIGQLLFVRINLPNATIEAVVSILNHHRLGDDKRRKWFLGVKIHQISDLSKADLDAYLEKRGRDEPLVLMG
jgi:hypothetical protein